MTESGKSSHSGNSGGNVWNGNANGSEWNGNAGRNGKGAGHDRDL